MSSFLAGLTGFCLLHFVFLLEFELYVWILSWLVGFLLIKLFFLELWATLSFLQMLQYCLCIAFEMLTLLCLAKAVFWSFLCRVPCTSYILMSYLYPNWEKFWLFYWIDFLSHSSFPYLLLKFIYFGVLLISLRFWTVLILSNLLLPWLCLWQIFQRFVF